MAHVALRRQARSFPVGCDRSAPPRCRIRNGMKHSGYEVICQIDVHVLSVSCCTANADAARLEAGWNSDRLKNSRGTDAVASHRKRNAHPASLSIRPLSHMTSGGAQNG